jgi:hypothetical protein
MSYHVTSWTGQIEKEYPSARFGELLDQLSKADAEHPDVAVTHESEWSITVYKSGFVVLENLEDGEPTHLGPLDKTAIVQLMVAVAEGRIDELQAMPWVAGYPPRRT